MKQDEPGIPHFAPWRFPPNVVEAPLVCAGGHIVVEFARRRQAAPLRHWGEIDAKN